MTIASRELFEPCKQVYEATGWDDLADDHDWFTERGVIGYKRNGVAPLYTSDYLLEKLQQSLKHKNDQIDVFNDSKGWSAKLKINFIDGDDIYHYREVNDSYGHATPLLALLKLSLKLHEDKLL